MTTTGKTQTKAAPAAPSPVNKKFSGTVHTLVFRPHEGFADYAVKTLVIRDGIVEEEAMSDPYAGFEALAKLETMNARLLEAMRVKYPAGYRHV